MSFRFQADADLDPEIGRGLRRREPAIDFRAAANVIPDGTPDPEVLQIAAQAGRVLVSRDVSTMPDHFVQFLVQHESPGVILIPSRRSIGAVIEGLLVVWLTWSSEDLCNQVRWIP
ncbi:MAG: DUF5615 family PIN-like protein [Acidobacteriaceae bacterium]|nr:DUF5615 family PIN-like protein [Acidobacteriaceae bacterium]